ncbi:MAG: AAA family ATPase, partial [Clostridia bacterium]|nr:AAA family ATPase [Clostridia bacterium]
TGVGKTELSKALAEAVFGDENAIIRIDMSEYMEKHSVSKLIGAPPGYVGFDDAGQLTEKIRRKPYSVVLFDEIEKAHPDVFNIMLQILEDGQLTDSHGRKVDFKNTIIIMTSNLGSSNITEPRRLGFSASTEEKDMKNKTTEVVMNALRENFRPEFLNRLDEIVIFNKLSTEDIEKITRLMLSEVTARINRLEIEIEFTDDVYSHISKVGFDPTYGARPLRRAIQQKIEDSFSTGMLEGNIKAGDKVICSLMNDEIVYKVDKQRENIDGVNENNDSSEE